MLIQMMIATAFLLFLWQNKSTARNLLQSFSAKNWKNAPNKTKYMLYECEIFTYANTCEAKKFISRLFVSFIGVYMSFELCGTKKTQKQKPYHTHSYEHVHISIISRIHTVKCAIVICFYHFYQ